MPSRTLLAMIVAGIALLSLVGCRGQPLDYDDVVREIRPAALRSHLEALQALADQNSGNRATGTSGYAASVRYVVSVLRKAGNHPKLDRFEAPVFRERRPPRLARLRPGPRTFEPGRDFRPWATPPPVGDGSD
jgi:hypothetical protein